MPTFQDILRVYHVQQVELQAWIEQRWVRPRSAAGGDWIFDEVDEARIALIHELRQDFSCDDNALHVVLSLLDQLYATRRVLKNVERALEALPEPLREQLRAQLTVPDNTNAG